MKTLKQIADEMDCHHRTARRWWRKLGVPPDETGHGPNKWLEESAAQLIRLYRAWFTYHGTTTEIRRRKFSGQENKQQLQLNLK